MTFAGKKLQEIYDSGSERLLELETNASANLKKTSQTHVQSRKNGDDTAVGSIDTRSKELEADLRTFMDESIGRLTKTLEGEVKETLEHLDAVKADLTALSDKLKHSIAELKRTYDDQVHHIRTTLADQYEGTVESTTVELEKQDFVSSKHLRSHGTFVMNSLQQKLDHSLWESRGEEKQYNSALFKAFMQKANSIDTHFSTLMQKLSTDFQTHFKVLEGQASETEREVNQHAESLFEQVDQHASQLDHEVQEFYKTTKETHGRSLDTSLNAIAQDLSSVHDQTTKQLSEQTREMSSSLLSASGEARTTLGTKCTTLREQIDERLQSFKTRLQEKVGTSAALRETLEGEKSHIYQNIASELSAIHTGFEQRMSALMTESVRRVHSIAEEAEREINTAQHNCQSQLRTDSVSTKNEIDEAIGKFLELLSAQRNIALEEISKSASGSATTSTRKPSEARAKRAKKTTEDSPSS